MKVFLFAGVFSLLASAAHIAVIIGGPDWYRFFGAGEQMAVMAEQGSRYPAYVTIAIAAVLFIWGWFAFGAAGWWPRLPFTKWVLWLITLVLMVRGLGGLLLVVSGQGELFGHTNTFTLISSIIVSVYAMAYLFAAKNFHLHSS